MAVDVRPLTTGYGEEIRRARTESLQMFRQIIQESLDDHPGHREEILQMILDQLQALREEAREAGNTASEDIVLDAMDLLTGWAARAARV